PTATMWTASPSRPSRSAPAETPCSPQNTRSRSASACPTSPASRAGRTSIAARRYLARIPPDVVAQLGLRGVRALVDEHQLPARVVESRAREGERGAEHLRHLLVGVDVARIADRVAAQEARGVGVAVLGVDADER